MLRLISAIMFLIILVLSFLFLIQNLVAFTYDDINISYNLLIYKAELAGVPVYALMILSWIGGVMFTFFLELISWLRVRGKMSEQAKTIKRMERELQDLRTMPFSDTDPVDESVPEE